MQPCPLVVLVVFLSEFALTESRVGRSLEELLKFVDGVFGVYVEVGVGILYISLGKPLGVEDCVFVVGSCVAPFLVGSFTVAAEHEDRGLLGVGFVGLLVVFGDFLFVLYGVGVEVCASDGGEHGGILLIDFLGLVEESLGTLLVALDEGKRTLAYLVESALGVCGKTLVEVGLGGCVVLVVESDFTEVVVGESLVGRGIVEVAFEDFFGVVKLVGLEVLDSVEVALLR